MPQRISSSNRGDSRERKVRERGTHVMKKEGNIMSIAEKDVVSTHPLNSVKNAQR